MVLFSENKKRSLRNKPARGFTLIELLIVIAIIGIMTALILTYLNGAKAKGRDADRIGDIKQIELAIESYFSSCNAYPTTLSDLSADCSGNPIMTSIPSDPSGEPYSYFVVTDPTLQYHLCASLELGYAGGIGKSGHAKINRGDPCDGTDASVFDRYGPGS